MVNPSQGTSHAEPVISSLATQTWMSQWTCTVELAIGIWFSSINSKTVYEYRSKSFAAQVAVELKQSQELSMIENLRGVQVKWSPSLDASEWFWVVSIGPEIVVECQVVVPDCTLRRSEDSVRHRGVLHARVNYLNQVAFYLRNREVHLLSNSEWTNSRLSESI